MSQQFDFELVGKIGSMALIRKADNDIDYNIFSQLGKQLRPGWIWVSSGATEIGRLDYLRRTGHEVEGDTDEVKADYASQGQAILMQNYRQFINPQYSVRQLLVEHWHFNDAEKREHIRKLLLRAGEQGAIPIVNYNDPVSAEENRKMEMQNLRQMSDSVVECVDNDETAAEIARLVKAKYLVILTGVDGIYRDVANKATLVEEIPGKNAEEVMRGIDDLQGSCVGASRVGANGAGAKLQYAKSAVEYGATVIIGHARYAITDMLEGNAPCTRIGVR